MKPPSAEKWLRAAEKDYLMQADWAMWLALLFWVQKQPIYSCDDLGVCNRGPKHDCVDCPNRKR